MKAKILKVFFYVDLAVFILAIVGIIVNAVISNMKLIVPFIFLAGLSGVQLLRWREKKNEDTKDTLSKS